MFRPFVLVILASVAGITNANLKTEWYMITPDPDLDTTMMVYTVLAIVVTIVQFLHCLAVVVHMEAEPGKHTFAVLFAGLVSLLALYTLRAYFLTHYNTATHLSRPIYAMLYFTEQFSNIMITFSTMILLRWAEGDWYKNAIILRVRKGLGLLLVVAWLALVVAQTIMYRPPTDVDHNALLTVALYQDRLTDAIIAFYNLVTLDIAISSFVLWIHVRKLPEPDSGPDHRIKILLLISPLLAIRTLALVVVHVVSLVSIPAHLVNTIWDIILVRWLVLDPTLCYAALYALLRASGVPFPIQFKTIVAACLAIVGALLKGMSVRRTHVVRDENSQKIGEVEESW
ncbi:hypothetical protein GGX14DRAFT_567972 [Mycena pura]|uniref:Uncharacterized protein n=1 Tax=Mycena pura TaxID=153505 RepID=A0AAD6YB66_9AGAR|nr:hypothetical protein GGX14DRAFT_567972 [Mycena pura]